MGPNFISKVFNNQSCPIKLKTVPNLPFYMVLKCKCKNRTCHFLNYEIVVNSFLILAGREIKFVVLSDPFEAEVRMLEHDNI